MNADAIAVILAEDAVIEDGRITNIPYLAVKIAEAADGITDDMIERGLVAMNKGLIDARQPFHESDKSLMRAALSAALQPT